MDFKYRYTVFTPTYNRAYIIEQLYHSLKRQTFKNFEWLIVDDGSTDETEELFKKLIQDTTQFQIRYIKKENEGKCQAINLGLDEARGELFFTVDSDDYLTDDALEVIDRWFNTINDPLITGVVANKGYAINKTTNYLFEEEFIDKSLLDTYSFYRNGNQVLDGERACVFYTEFHRKYKYPFFQGEHFMTESIAWNRMAHDGYKMRFVNDIVWIFEYRDDGLTKAGRKIVTDNTRGYGLWLKEKTEFQNNGIWTKLNMHYTFVCDLQEEYSSDFLAECISISIAEVRIIKVIHLTSRLIKSIKTYIMKRQKS